MTLGVDEAIGQFSPSLPMVVARPAVTGWKSGTLGGSTAMDGIWGMARAPAVTTVVDAGTAGMAGAELVAVAGVAGLAGVTVVLPTSKPSILVMAAVMAARSAGV